MLLRVWNHLLSGLCYILSFGRPPASELLIFRGNILLGLAVAAFVPSGPRDSTGGDPQQVMTGTGVGHALYWAADGRLIYSFHEDAKPNAAADSLWAIKVDPNTGKPTGSPQRLSKGLGSIAGLTVSADGKRAGFLRNNMEDQVFIAEFDKNTRRLGAPYRLTLDENGNLPTAWTPDSKSVLFASNRNGTWKIFKQPIDQATAELI